MPQQVYQKNCDNLEQLISAQHKKLRGIMIARIVAFFILIMIIAIAIKLFLFYILFFTLIPLIAFGLLVKKNETEKTNLSLLNHTLSINENEIACLNGEYSKFDDGKEFIDPNHSYSHDIDLFGEKSLFQYLNRTSSQSSKKKLAEFLSNYETDKETIINRQKSINELSDKLVWRQEFGSKGMQFKSFENEIKELINWQSEEIQLFHKQGLWRIILWAVPLIVFSAILAFSFSLISGMILIFFLLAPLSIVGKYIKTINAQHRKISSYVDVLKHNNALTELIEKERFESQILGNIKSKLIVGNKSASNEIGKLALITQQLDNRSNPVFAFLMNSLFLWDLQYLYKLKNWLNSNQGELKNWFDSVNEMEVFISLSNFHYNHPDFCLPNISTHTILETKEIGHPLLNAESRIDNNFELNGLQEFVIITGANMAGKSTFLRTIGTNLVLAMSGTKVCASEFNFSPLPLFTSMRTSDSLSDNESYFYSELKRLQLIVEKLKKGDTIATSSFSRFPPKIMIGRVIKKMEGGAGSGSRYKIKLGTNFKKLDFVYVVVDEVNVERKILEDSLEVSDNE